jgi:hypothetical protein
MCKDITKQKAAYYFVSMFDVVVAYLPVSSVCPSVSPSIEGYGYTPHDLWHPPGSQVGTMDTTMDSWSCLELGLASRILIMWLLRSITPCGYCCYCTHVTSKSETTLRGGRNSRKIPKILGGPLSTVNRKYGVESTYCVKKSGVTRVTHMTRFDNLLPYWENTRVRTPYLAAGSPISMRVFRSWQYQS